MAVHLAVSESADRAKPEAEQATQSAIREKCSDPAPGQDWRHGCHTADASHARYHRRDISIGVLASAVNYKIIEHDAAVARVHIWRKSLPKIIKTVREIRK